MIMKKVRYRIAHPSGLPSFVVAQQWRVTENGALVFTNSVPAALVKVFADGTWTNVEPAEES